MNAFRRSLKIRQLGPIRCSNYCTRVTGDSSKKNPPGFTRVDWVWISSDKLAHRLVEAAHGDSHRQQVLHGPNIILHLLRLRIGSNANLEN